MSGSENYDIDSFLDLSGGLSDSGSRSTSTSLSNSASQTPIFPEAPHLALNQTFSGPSHRYDLHPQQTGLLPSSSQMSLSQDDFQLGFGGMDLESDPMFSMPSFFPESSFNSDFVDPTDVNFGNSQELDLDALAGIKQERSPSNASMASVPSQGKKKAAAPPDAATEERIRQLLEDVKRKALSSQAGDLDDEDHLPHIARMKKDEEDMDEDERLLASEEGKKLSSKERRQLRNKVSARAFRSRRKEYIGQLETEVANKSNECVDLKKQLNAVEAENKSLKELTRMLLASPQFSSFLDQMNPLNTSNLAAFTGSAGNQQQQSAFGDNITVHRASVPTVQLQQPQQQQQQQHHMDFPVPSYIPPHQQFLNTYNPRKDVNPSRAQSGVEEWPLAYQAPGAWGIGNATVFAAEIPQIIIDASELAGKSILDSDIFAPADGFRPGSFKPLTSEKQEPGYNPSSYDNNGQYIYDVYEDELEDVPEYLYSHMDIHSPVTAKEDTETMDVGTVLPSLGLAQLFGQIEQQLLPKSLDSPAPREFASESCIDLDFFKTLRSIETSYSRLGALCGL